MDSILVLLLQARNNAHVLHWKTKSFARHLALGEIYDKLGEFADKLAEVHMGLTGQKVNPDLSNNQFKYEDELIFIKALMDILNSENIKSLISQDFIQNIYQELQAQVAQTKYKLEQLQ